MKIPEVIPNAAPDRRIGIECPRCKQFIEIRIEDLLRRSLFRCKHCGLELTLNRFPSRDSLDSLTKIQRAVEDLYAVQCRSSENPMANEEEKVESVGPLDPALRSSPILQASTARPEDAENASYDCYYNGKRYSNGALICQAGEVFQCSYGYWIDQQRSCGQAE